MTPNRCPVGSTPVTVLSQDFSGSFPPAGWVVANSTTGCVAPGVPDWTNTDPGADGNLTGGSGAFADADSDSCGFGSVMNAQMWSAVMNLTGLTNPQVTYYTDYNDLATGDDLGDLDFSVDGGTTWTNLISWDADHRGPLMVTQPFAAANQANTVLRWNYINATWDWWWQVDSVEVTACQGERRTAQHRRQPAQPGQHAGDQHHDQPDADHRQHRRRHVELDDRRGAGRRAQAHRRLARVAADRHPPGDARRR